MNVNRVTLLLLFLAIGLTSAACPTRIRALPDGSTGDEAGTAGGGNRGNIGGTVGSGIGATAARGADPASPGAMGEPNSPTPGAMGMPDALRTRSAIWPLGHANPSSFQGRPVPRRRSARAAFARAPTASAATATVPGCASPVLPARPGAPMAFVRHCRMEATPTTTARRATAPVGPPPTAMARVLVPLRAQVRPARARRPARTVN